MSVATGCVSNFQDYFVVGAPIVFHGFKAKAVTDSVELALQRKPLHDLCNSNGTVELLPASATKRNR